MNANYHTHTVRCHHAIGSEREYIEKAISRGFKKLGFSDHTDQQSARGKRLISPSLEQVQRVVQIKLFSHMDVEFRLGHII